MVFMLERLNSYLVKHNLHKEARQIREFIEQEDLTKKTYTINNSINKKLSSMLSEDFAELEGDSNVFFTDILEYFKRNNLEISSDDAKDYLEDAASMEVGNFLRELHESFMKDYFYNFVLEKFKKHFSHFPDVIQWLYLDINSHLGQTDEYLDDFGSVSRFMQDLLHDVHHAVTFPLAYQKFLNFGFDIKSYGIIDMFEEVLVDGIDSTFSRNDKYLKWNIVSNFLVDKYKILLPLQKSDLIKVYRDLDIEAKDPFRKEDTLIEIKVSFIKELFKQLYEKQETEIDQTANTLWLKYDFGKEGTFIEPEKEEALIEFLKDIDDSFPEIKKTYNQYYDQILEESINNILNKYNYEKASQKVPKELFLSNSNNELDEDSNVPF